MATSASAIAPPPGYTLETQTPTPPPGYSIEGSQPQSPISQPPIKPEFDMPAAAAKSFGVTDLIDSAKQAWAAGQSTRDAEAQVAKNVTDLVKKGDFGTAAETLLSHLYHGAVNTTKQQLTQGGQDLVNTAKGIYKSATTPNDPNTMLDAPITPMPGISGLAGDFADSEATVGKCASGGGN